MSTLTQSWVPVQVVDPKNSGIGPVVSFVTVAAPAGAAAPATSAMTSRTTLNARRGMSAAFRCDGCVITFLTDLRHPVDSQEWLKAGQPSRCTPAGAVPA